MPLPRPTGAAPAAVALAVALGLVGRVVGDVWVYAAGAALAGWIVTAALFAGSVRGLTVEVTTAARARRGEQVAVLVASRAGGRAIAAHTLTVEHPAFGRCVVRMPSLAPGQDAVAELTATPGRRGSWPDTGRWTASTLSPLGLFRRRGRGEASGMVIVHPAAAQALPLPASAGEVGGSRRSRDAGPGVEVHGLRDWRPGDHAAAVHGRASARRGRPVVLEREPDGEGPLVVVVGRPAGDWEDGVARAAATTVAAVRAGRAVTLLGPVPAPPVRPRERDVLDWFAALPDVTDATRPVGEHAAARALRRAGPGATCLRLGSTG